eukprot:3810754-Pleurochrysis_carterae.AAC.2
MMHKFAIQTASTQSLWQPDTIACTRVPVRACPRTHTLRADDALCCALICTAHALGRVQMCRLASPEGLLKHN